MRYIYNFKICINFKLILNLFALVIVANGSLYPFGPDAGDATLNFNPWNGDSSVRIDLERGVPMFEGGMISSIWVNAFGFISLNDTTFSHVRITPYNVIMAPFFITSEPGMVYYQQTTNTSRLVEQISRDITMFEGDVGDFEPEFALMITWSQIGASNSLIQANNSFQLVLTTDLTKTYLIFNYAPIRWHSFSGQSAVAGIYAIGNSMQLCSQFLQGSATPEIRHLASTSNIMGSRGRHVIDISDPLNCTSNFSSLCEGLPRNGRGIVNPKFSLSGSGTNLQWSFFVEFTCKPGLVIAPDVTSRRIECSYDSDYYMYMWQISDAPTCIDLNATFTFVSTIKLENQSFSFLSADQLNRTNAETILRLLEDIDIKDVAVGKVSTTSNGTNATTIEFTTFVPPYTNRQLTRETLITKLTSELNATVDVTDATGSCLQACLCRNLKDPVLCKGKGRPIVPPDACCGKCGGPQKAYASSIKACCNDRVLYDPTTSICCKNGVRKGSVCPNSNF